MHFNFLKTKNKSKAFSLVEMLIYIAITTSIMIVIVDIVSTVSKSNKQSFVYNNIKNSAISSLEKIIRETRTSVSVDTTNSVLNSTSTNGVLVLNSKTQNGDPMVIKFYVDNQLLKVDTGSDYVNLNYFGPLNTNGTKVTALTFNNIDTGNSEAIKIKISIQGEKNGFVKTEDFYSTAVLRGSY